MPAVSRWRWGLLIALAAAAFLLRVHDLSRIFLWLDETDFFNPHVWGPHPQSLLDFAEGTKDSTTNTMGWPGIIWINCRLFAATLAVARAGAAVAGTAAVVLVFVLVYRLFSGTLEVVRFVPAMLAAALTAIAIPQIEFSQRTYPYGAITLASTALLLAHLEVFRSLTAGVSCQLPRLMTYYALTYYTSAGVFALFIHPSLVLLVGASAAFLAVQALRVRNIGFFKAALVAAPILCVAALLNAKNPRLGHRVYLPEYYQRRSFQAIANIAGLSYDLLAYNLNLFYNSSLYWPRAINWALMPLVLLCASGWVLAIAGKFGAQARQLAQLGLAVIVMLALLSTVGIFPFGGVRQTLLLSPFLFAFTGLAAWFLCRQPAARVIVGLAGTAYLAAWAFNLPRFYEERVAVFGADDIVRAWHQNGELPVYTRGSEWELQYVMRNHPEIEVRTLAPFPKAPYLLVATHWPPLENQTFYFGYSQSLAKDGYHAALVMSKPAFHLDSLTYRASLYYPPNSFWVYKITGQ
jgi:hypothetical protein